MYSLKSKPCHDCGGTFQSECMDFDHVRGEKITSIGRMVTGNKARVLAEITKCDLVCACCHRVRTQARQGTTALGYKQVFNTKVNKLKSEPCMDCGRCFPPEAMDFDHIRGEKLREVGSMGSYAWKRVLAEIAKCELVCANCHRTRTTQRIERAA